MGLDQMDGYNLLLSQSREVFCFAEQKKVGTQKEAKPEKQNYKKMDGTLYHRSFIYRIALAQSQLLQIATLVLSVLLVKTRVAICSNCD